MLAGAALSPEHASHRLPVADFALRLLVPVLLGTFAGVICRAARGRGLGSLAAAMLHLFLVAVALVVSLCCLFAWLEGGALQRRELATREVYARKKALSDGRPRVVLMIPARQGLHPDIERKAAAALAAMQAGNPSLNLTTFIFDKVVPRESGDDRPLSKVTRIRNMMLHEANVREDFDYVMWVDSDLVSYPADLPTALIRANPEGVTAPLVLVEEPGPLGRVDQFYDTTAFVRLGR